MKDLIKKLASKKLSFGCHLKLREDGECYDIWESTLKKYNPLVVKGFENGFVQVGSPDKYHSEFIDVKKGIDILFEILGHPVYIGDVLEGIGIVKGQSRKENVYQLYFLWRSCGLARSLQQIEEESGYENVCEEKHFPERKAGQEIKWKGCRLSKKQLKDPNARALAKFIKGTII